MEIGGGQFVACRDRVSRLLTAVIRIASRTIIQAEANAVAFGGDSVIEACRRRQKVIACAPIVISQKIVYSVFSFVQALSGKHRMREAAAIR